MAKKKQETVSDIIDRIEEDLMTLRDKVEELENHECCEEEDEDDKATIKSRSRSQLL